MNQWQTLLDLKTAQTWLIWAASSTWGVVEPGRSNLMRSPKELVMAARGTALRAREGCRSKAGHHPYQRNMVNVGSVGQAPTPCASRTGRVNVA